MSFTKWVGYLCTALVASVVMTQFVFIGITFVLEDRLNVAALVVAVFLMLPLFIRPARLPATTMILVLVVFAMSTTSNPAWINVAGVVTLAVAVFGQELARDRR